MKLQRRDFINNLSQVTAFVCAGSLMQACSKSSGSPSSGGNNNGGGGSTVLITADLSSEITAIGDSKMSGNTILIRTADGNAAGSFIALSLVCTHQGCIVAFDSSADVFNCPCHGSKYNGNGGVINGPATKALQKFTVTVTGTALTVHS